jgi:hypothetical protein
MPLQVWDDAAGGTGWRLAQLPADGSSATATSAAVQGGPVFALSWSACYQAVAACCFQAGEPIRVYAYDPTRPPVSLPAGLGGAAGLSAASASRRALQQEREQQARRQKALAGRRYELPDRLTPEHVRALLADVRASARARGLLAAAGGSGSGETQGRGGDGEQLVLLRGTC